MGRAGPLARALLAAPGLLGKVVEALPWLAPMAHLRRGRRGRILAKALGFAPGSHR